MFKDLFKDLAKYLPSYIVPFIVGIISFPIITHLISPGEYGDYILVQSTIMIFSSLASSWLSFAVLRFYPAYSLDNRIETLLSISIKLMIISIVIFSILGLVALIVIQDYMSENLYNVMSYGLLLFIVTSIFEMLLHILRSKRIVTTYSYFIMWRTIAGFIFSIVLIYYFHLGAKGLILGYFLSILVAIPPLYKYAIGKINFKMGSIFSSITLEIIKYGFPSGIINLSNSISIFSARYILNYFRGNEEVGIYSAGYKITQNSISSIPIIISAAANPISFEIWEHQGVHASQVFLTRLARYYLLIGLPAFVGLSMLSKSIMHILTEASYFPGYQVIPFIAFTFFVIGITNRFTTVIVYYKKTYIIMFVNILSAIINLGLNILFVPEYGYLASAIIISFVVIIDFVIKVFISRRLLTWTFPFKSLGKIACASAAMGLVIYIFGNSLNVSNIFNLLIIICAGGAAYFIMLLILSEFKPEEIEKVRSIVYKFVKKS